MPRPEVMPEPWNAFFADLDSVLPEEVHLHCLGGFVISVCYGMERPTDDVDFTSLHPNDQNERVLSLAGESSPLRRKHKVYLQRVTVANLPEGYEDRLIEMFPGTYRNVHLFALDPYDLALTKIDRNIQRDRDDVKHLVKTVPLDRQILQDRFERELRPIFVGDARRAELTIKLWIEAFY
jgi:uncharacterized nucleotidyltransferase DUF6036